MYTTETKPGSSGMLMRYQNSLKTGIMKIRFLWCGEFVVIIGSDLHAMLCAQLHLCVCVCVCVCLCVCVSVCVCVCVCVQTHKWCHVVKISETPSNIVK